jgi:hypothetical protein
MSASEVETTGEAGTKAAKLPDTSAEPIAKLVSMMKDGQRHNKSLM